MIEELEALAEKYKSGELEGLAFREELKKQLEKVHETPDEEKIVFFHRIADQMIEVLAPDSEDHFEDKIVYYDSSDEPHYLWENVLTNLFGTYFFHRFFNKIYEG